MHILWLFILIPFILIFYFYVDNIQEGIKEIYNLETNNFKKEIVSPQNNFYIGFNSFFIIFIISAIFFYGFFYWTDNTLAVGKILNESHAINSLTVNENNLKLQKNLIQLLTQNFELLEKRQTQNHLAISDLIFKKVVHKLQTIQSMIIGKTEDNNPSIEGIEFLYHSAIKWGND